MTGGSVSVLAGTGLGLVPWPAFLESGRSDPLLLLPSLALSLGGGYAVLFPGISVNRSGLRIFRDWRRHPRAGKVLWVLSLAIAVGGLVTCVLAGAASPLAPGLLVGLFMGLYLTSAGWASAMMGLAGIASDKALNEEPENARATVPSR